MRSGCIHRNSLGKGRTSSKVSIRDSMASSEGWCECMEAENRMRQEEQADDGDAGA